MYSPFHRLHAIVPCHEPHRLSLPFPSPLTWLAICTVPHPQALILAPTREIAIQSEQVISKLAQGLPEPRPACAAFVGGLSIVADEKKLRRLGGVWGVWGAKDEREVGGCWKIGVRCGTGMV